MRPTGQILMNCTIQHFIFIFCLKSLNKVVLIYFALERHCSPILPSF